MFEENLVPSSSIIDIRNSIYMIRIGSTVSGKVNNLSWEILTAFFGVDFKPRHNGISEAV
jgi:hypothetical protein